MNYISVFFDQFILLSPEAKSMVMDTIEYKQIPKNTLILKAGNHNRYMYIIKKGVVRGFITNNDVELTMSLWMENETFGDAVTYIDGSKSIKSYDSLEDLEVFVVDIAKFRSLFDKSIEISNLGRIMIERFVLKTETLKNSLRLPSPQERFDFFLENRPGLIGRVKLKYIASYLSITPETLSRIRTSHFK
jgi:CRP/FNR family transcriptional regulator, anaerobic regulatory protein